MFFQKMKYQIFQFQFIKKDEIFRYKKCWYRRTGKLFGVSAVGNLVELPEHVFVGIRKK
jgi:hypothetical protein